MPAPDDALRVYMVDREMPGITPEELADAQAAEIAACERLAAEGKPIRYLRSTFVPGEDRLMCLFAAPNSRLVQEANEAAGLPFTWIVEAIDLPRDAAPARPVATIYQPFEENPDHERS